MEPEVDFVEEKPTRKKYRAKCYHCKDTEHMKDEHNPTFDIDLHFKYIDIPKDKELLKECKDLIKNAEGKYYNTNVVKRALYHGCPYCGHTIFVNCKDYVDFYTPKKVLKSKDDKKSEEISK